VSKRFSDIQFDLATFEREVNEYESLLQKPWLSERSDILPFFKARPILSSQIATDFSGMVVVDKIAFEYDVFGDFACDVAIGNTVRSTYCFVEFEDAQENSIFQKGTRYKPAFGQRLEHGYSQVMDWFCKIETMRNSPLEFVDRFGVPSIEYHGILIIGRNSTMDATMRYRLDWRSKNLRLLHKHVVVSSYDDLLMHFKDKLETIHTYRQS
jgi:Domain of unknown function (DUF4263)